MMHCYIHRYRGASIYTHRYIYIYTHIYIYMCVCVCVCVCVCPDTYLILFVRSPTLVFIQNHLFPFKLPCLLAIHLSLVASPWNIRPSLVAWDPQTSHFSMVELQLQQNHDLSSNVRHNIASSGKCPQFQPPQFMYWGPTWWRSTATYRLCKRRHDGLGDSVVGLAFSGLFRVQARKMVDFLRKTRDMKWYNVNPGLINPNGCLIGGVPFKYWIMTIGGVPP